MALTDNPQRLRPGDVSWTDKRVAELKRLWHDGFSAAQIAAELGGTTRNAVIGKVCRLGLSGRVKVPSQSREGRKRNRDYHWRKPGGSIAPVKTANPKHIIRAPKFEPEPLPPSPPIDAPLGQRRTLLELTEGVCRWPFGDPGTADFHFCGGNAVGGYPYCAYHCRIAYETPVARQRRRERERAA